MKEEPGKYILQPPKLAIDTGRKQNPEGELERRIAWNLLAHLALRNYTPISVDVGEEAATVNSSLEVMELLFDCDVAFIYFRHGPPGGPWEANWVKLIRGNGMDLIANWASRTGGGQWQDSMESFDSEDYQ